MEQASNHLETETERTVARHYGVEDPGTRLYQGLRRAGVDLTELAADDLAPADEFHIRGRESTEELCELASFSPEDRVLDVGCGIGGSARYLAERFGCHVTGIDLTEEYCRLATELSSKLGLSDRTAFHQASAVRLPFGSETFDVAWTEHAQMNIADKDAFYGEISRVLRPGGRLVFHDVFAGSTGSLAFPVPWSSVPSSSFLSPPEDARALLADFGLEPEIWRDCTEKSAAWFQNVRDRIRQNGPPAVGVHLLMGDSAAVKVHNATEGFSSGALVTVQAVLRKVR